MQNPSSSHAPDSLSDFTTDSRVLLLSAMAVVVGAMAAVVAWCLVRLIDLITNISFSAAFLSPMLLLSRPTWARG